MEERFQKINFVPTVPFANMALMIAKINAMKFKILILLVVCASIGRAQIVQSGFWFNPADSGFVVTYKSKQPILDKYCEVTMYVINSKKNFKDTIVVDRVIWHLDNEDSLHIGNIPIMKTFDLYELREEGNQIYVAITFPSSADGFFMHITTKDFCQRTKRLKKELAERKNK